MEVLFIIGAVFWTCVILFGSIGGMRDGDGKW
jgi:hypothetical protein